MHFLMVLDFMCVMCSMIVGFILLNMVCAMILNLIASYIAES